MHAITGWFSRRRLVLAGVTAALGVCMLVAVLETRGWAESYVAGDRMLPGVAIAGVEVGGMSVERATLAVEADLDRRLDREITVRDRNHVWTVSPRELGAHVDIDAAVADAADASSDTGWGHIAAARWVGTDIDLEIDAPPVPDPDLVAGLVDDIADDVDVAPVSATVRWGSSGAEVVADEVGRAVDRSSAGETLTTAVREEDQEVALPVIEDQAPIRAADLEPLLPAFDRAVEDTLGRSVTLTDGEASWEVPVGDVAIGAALGELAETAIHLAQQGLDTAGIADGLGRVPMRSDPAGLDALLDALAEEVAVDPVNAGVDYSTGWVELTPSRQGRALDRESAAEAISAGLRSAGHTVELPTMAVDPARSREDYQDVLLVRQNERRLYHYRDGEIVADWPVAVGTTSQPTPTGMFSIGTKRYLPTWHNPAQDRWGADMPEVIGPGPTNPLGMRALNWNRNGVDTLIRFHGTAQTDSIGRAASNGCVRLSNGDIVELYDRIPEGTTVVSVHG